MSLATRVQRLEKAVTGRQEGTLAARLNEALERDHDEGLVSFIDGPQPEGKRDLRLWLALQEEST